VFKTSAEPVVHALVKFIELSVRLSELVLSFDNVTMPMTVEAHVPIPGVSNEDVGRELEVFRTKGRVRKVSGMLGLSEVFFGEFFAGTTKPCPSCLRKVYEIKSLRVDHETDTGGRVFKFLLESFAFRGPRQVRPT